MRLNWRGVLLHPLWLLAGGVALTQWLGDGFYPFSSFAMYSRLDDEATYIYLTDENESPLSTYERAGLSAAKVNKMFHSALREVCQRDRLRITRAPPKAKQEAVGELMRTLRRTNRDTGLSEFPPKVRVVQVVIEIRDGRLVQTPSLAGEG
jgi:hypothetical protein